MNRLSKIIVALMLGSATVNVPAHAYSSSLNDDGIGAGFVWQDQYNDPLLMPKTIKPVGENVFIFSPKARQWAAYNGSGQLVGFGRANGGGSFCAELNEPCLTEGGKFRVFRKGDSTCVSKTFPLDKGGGAAMPYCMFFNNGSAIHGSPQLSLMNSSHGCVRVTTPSAEWLSNNFIKIGTRVLITSY
ncbi:MAG: L,D-transpeptidase [Proteobacteria bacterium]|nr:L,D-transpeptidase [Pseudomonadota bacterium]